ncbi:MAG: TetR/AcrR family transcriptional regulator [Saprospiraceae bacterium]|nr:TetR/AcrR family transcriptional regulator [Saprospiraceae bacterium]
MFINVSTLYYIFEMTTKEKILEVTLELINQKGYHQVGVREIARHMQISPGNLSYHFARKEDILIQLVEALRQANDLLYDEYPKKKPTIENFLVLITKVFQSQYRFRGILLGNQIVRQELESTGSFHYPQTVNRRKDALKVIFQELAKNQQIKADESNIDLMVSFMSPLCKILDYGSTFDGK